MSDGSGVDIMTFHLLSFQHEINAIRQLNNIKVNHSLQCSTMLVNDKNNFIGFGHNEDGWSGTEDYGYFVNATYTDSNISKSHFAFQYPGSIIGHAFGTNYYGLSLSMNAIFPINVTNNSRGIYFITRALLDAHNISHATDIINSSGISYGGSVNIAQLIYFFNHINFC